MKRGMMNTINRWIQQLSTRARWAMISSAILAMGTTAGGYPGLAQQSAQQTFPSAAEASQSLFQAVQHNNVQAIANILGGPTELIQNQALELRIRDLLLNALTVSSGAVDAISFLCPG
jgi:hypothetical protein